MRSAEAQSHADPAFPRIVVADDDLDDAELMRMAFKKAGVPATLHFLNNGRELVDYLQAIPFYANGGREALPDLLLLDLKMPDMDGFEVLEWLRRHPPFDRLPVVVFSGSDQPVDIDRALKLGAYRYLVKPHKLPDLVQMVTAIYRFCLKLQADNTNALEDSSAK